MSREEDIIDRARTIAQIGMNYDFEGTGFRLDKKYIRIARYVEAELIQAKIDALNWFWVQSPKPWKPDQYQLFAETVSTLEAQKKLGGLTNDASCDE